MIMMCDFDNEQCRCQRCGFVAGGRDWNKNCKGPPSDALVGDYLAGLIAHLGLSQKAKCKCKSMIRKMNSWGRAGCQENRAIIVSHLKEAYAGTSHGELITAVTRSITTGLAFRLNPLDPLGSLVDLAITDAPDYLPT